MPSVVVRVLQKIIVGSISAARRDLEPCWLWVGSTNQDGYGVIRLKDDTEKWITRVVHRLFYNLYFKSVPSDMELDHLCRVRNCCNFWHFEVVTHGENTRRGTHTGGASRAKTRCPQGHPLEEGNLVVWMAKKGLRRCLICQRRQMRESYRRVGGATRTRTENLAIMSGVL